MWIEGTAKIKKSGLACKISSIFKEATRGFLINF
jgi:hypothetical protein